MIKVVLRVVIGFLVACVAAGLTMVLFVDTPLELVGEMAGERLSEVGLLALFAATHSAMFASPFALIGAGFGEWQRIGSWVYYTVVGVCISGIGFLAQFWTEGEGEASIVNGYAVTAFIATGIAAGIVYWLVAGRFAGGNDEKGGVSGEIIAPARSEPPAPRTGGSSAKLTT